MPLALLMIPIVLFALQARADDGDLQRALIELSCPTAKVTRLNPIGKSEVYEARCFDKRIKIVCMNGRCSADSPSLSRNDHGELPEITANTRNFDALHRGRRSADCQTGKSANGQDRQNRRLKLSVFPQRDPRQAGGREEFLRLGTGLLERPAVEGASREG